MQAILTGLRNYWHWLDRRIEASGRDLVGQQGSGKLRHIMTIPGIGPKISTALVAAVG